MVAKRGGSRTVQYMPEQREAVRRFWRNPRGFTITEVVVVLVVTGILATIAVPTYQAIRQNTNRNSQNMALTGYVAKARQVASRVGNQYQYPADLVEELNALDGKISDAASVGENTVSSWRESGEVVVFARLGANGRCYLVRDDIASDTQTYAYDPEPSECRASLANGLGITGELNNPNTIALP